MAGFGDILFGSDSFKPDEKLTEILRAEGLENLLDETGTLDLWDPVARPGDIDGEAVSQTLTRLAA